MNHRFYDRAAYLWGLEDLTFPTKEEQPVQYVITATKNRTRFYLTPEHNGTDILGRAKRYQWYEEAKRTAKETSSDPAWTRFGFTTWSVLTVNAGCDLCGDGAVDSGLCPVCEEGLENEEDN